MDTNLTYKILAFPVVDTLDPIDCADWAAEMLALGHETPNLLMLASFYKPTSYYDVEPFLMQAIKELNLEPKNGEDGIISYASFFVRQIAEKQSVRRNLRDLCEFCESKRYENSVYDFYLLSWAWNDFDYGSKRTDYWQNISPSSIESEVVNVAKAWMFKNKEKLHTTKPIRNAT